MSALKSRARNIAAALMIVAGVSEAQTTSQDLEKKKAEIRARREQGARPAASAAVHCAGIKLDGSPSTYNVDSLGGMLSVRDATTLALMGMDTVDGKTARIAGVNVPGSELTVQKLGQACLDQQAQTAPVVAPPPAVETTKEPAIMASTGRHVISVDTASRTVTVNDTGVSPGGPVPVKIVVELLAPKNSDVPVPSGFRFEWDETHGSGDNALKMHKVLTYDGRIEEQKGINLAKGMKGFGTALGRKGASTRAGNSTDMSLNDDKTFKEVSTAGSNTTTTHYGGHDQSDYSTTTGKTDPRVAMGTRMINSLRLDLEAADEAIKSAKFVMPEFTTAIGSDRGQREDRRMQEIAAKAGLGGGTQ